MIDIDAVRPFGAGVAFGQTASDYAAHRAGFPVQFFKALTDRGLLAPGMKVLDIGTGTGTIARRLAQAGAVVSAVDPAAELMAAAAKQDAEVGVTVRYRQASAETLPFAQGTFDLAVAGQCWHWFDRPRAAAELARVLKSGGTGVIAHFDWLPLLGSVAEATESLILAHNPNWVMAGGTGIYPLWPGDLTGAGLTGVETFSFDVVHPYTHIAWRGRIRASAGVAASLDAAGVAAFDAALAKMLETRFPADPLQVPHRVWAVRAGKPE
ncbi:MAG: methyltransferase domain-containing protein [Rhodobacteraceae bacterium]|nr:methyltransferase domain-containing protein [Paracoccaceae bacterium]